MNETKTPNYNKKAVAKYQQNKDRVNLLLDKGTKDRIKSKYGNISINQYIKDLIDKDLKQDIKTDSTKVQFANNPFEN